MITRSAIDHRIRRAASRLGYQIRKTRQCGGKWIVDIDRDDLWIGDDYDTIAWLAWHEGYVDGIQQRGMRA